MRMKSILKSCGLVLLLSAVTLTAAEWNLANREKTLNFKLTLDATALSYQVAALSKGAETVVVESSPLGIVRRDEAFTNGLAFVSAGKPKKFDTSYSMVTGKQRKLRDRGVEQSFAFKNAHGAPLEIVVRAYADGVAFAYRFPDATGKEITITADASGFNIPAGDAWMLPYDPVGVWAPAYEGDWQNKIPVGTAAPRDKRGWCFPALFNVRDHWVMLTEVGMDGSCFASHLQPKAKGGLYQMRLPETEETYGVAPQEATAKLPWQSPWRVIITGEKLATIVESSLVHHLSAPSEIADTSWIKPGRVSWSWWSDMSSPGDYEKLKSFVDLSAELGWEYSLVDCGWPDMKGGNVWQLNDYAKSKGVGLILWYNSGGKHSQVMDAGPRDLMDDPARRDAEMAKLEKAGIKGIKVDFMQSDKQYVIRLYEDILRDAARHHLFVDFHGSTIPRGWSRTFPNLLSMEAVAGAEQYWSTNFAEHAHTLDTIYVCTRNVVGPMDYTPVIFGNAKERVPHQTTNPHELALAVAFESGLLHFADSVTNYLATPDFVKRFIGQVPVVWDETKFLAGEPGKFVVIARRRGDEWYVAGLNGELVPREIILSLGFIGGGKYQAELIYDGSESRAFTEKNFTVRQKEVINLEMAGRGGFVLKLQTN